MMDNGSSVDAISKAIPYVQDVSTARFWVHYGLVIAGFVLAVITYLSQMKEPAPYGKHAGNEPRKGWGPMIPQRIAHMASDGICCVIFFLVIFAAYGQNRTYTSYVFLGLWLSHYVHRGFIHPFVTRYGSDYVQLGITAGTILPNLLYSFVNSDFISSAVYYDHYYRDPRFIIGIVLFVVGWVINRWADFTLRSLRNQRDSESSPQELSERTALQGSTKYYMPSGFLFDYITCPNYFGEAVEWLGWTIATWSLAGLVWLLFCLATFVPRAKHNQQWYRKTFPAYPQSRKAFLPFVY